MNLTKHMERLQKLALHGMAITGEPAAVFNQITAIISDILDVPVVCLSEIRGGDLHFLSLFMNGAVTANAGSCPMDVTPCAAVKEAGEIRTFADVSEHFPRAEFLKTIGAVSYCGVPSFDSSGQVIAVTCLLDNRPREFTEEDRYLLQIFAQRIGLELERQRFAAGQKRAEEEIHRNYDTQQVINSLLKVSLENIPLEDILKQALDLILSISWLSLESKGVIFLVDDGADKLVLSAQKGLSGYLQHECAIIPFGRCLCGRAALTQEFTFAGSIDARHEIRYEGISPHGHYCVPILFSGKTLGVLGMYLREGHEQDEKEVEFLKAISNALAGIIRRKKIENEQDNLILELQNSLVRVSRSQKMWLETFDSIGDMISIQDNDFNIIKCNRAFADYFGLTPKDIINKKCYDFFHAGSLPMASCPQITTLRENRPATVEILEAKTNRIFQMSTFPFHFHDALFTGTIHIAKDVTGEREKEMRLIMSERLVSLGQMASGIAHEINNPLAAIAGCAEGLLNRVKKGQFTPELFEQYLKIIEEEIRRCKSITDGMLSFVREKTYERKEVDINESLNKTLEIIGFQGRLKNVRVIKNFRTEMPAIQGNEGELRQVFLAVITNALDAMKDSGTLNVETGHGAETVVVNISDTGPGIPPELINRIFDPFFTTKSEQGGTGLGLSIAGKIIANHNGSLCVVQSGDKGAAFRITLPF